MKTLLGILALVALLSTATYNNSLSGAQTAAPEAAGIALNLNASGDLPGMAKVTLQHDGANVTGGTLRMTVLPQNADASSSERGALVATLSGGTVTLTAEGTVASVSGVQVAVQSGTGEFASVTSGTGTLAVSANGDNPSQLSGTLILNF